MMGITEGVSDILSGVNTRFYNYKSFLIQAVLIQASLLISLSIKSSQNEATFLCELTR